MYRCAVSGQVSRPGELLTRWVIRKPDGNIAKELPVAKEVIVQLESGIPMAALQRKYAPPPVEVVAPVPKPSEPPTLTPVIVGEPVALKIGATYVKPKKKR